MSWKEAIREKKVIIISPNLERSKSLLRSSTKTLNFAEVIKLNEDNAGVLLSNYYEALIEMLHSLSYKQGFKVLDHLSFSYYLREKLKNHTLSLLFDKYLKIRNNLIYYGKELDIDTARQGIKDIRELISFIKKEL